MARDAITMITTAPNTASGRRSSAATSPDFGLQQRLVDERRTDLFGGKGHPFRLYALGFRSKIGATGDGIKPSAPTGVGHHCVARGQNMGVAVKMFASKCGGECESAQRRLRATRRARARYSGAAWWRALKYPRRTDSASRNCSSSSVSARSAWPALIASTIGMCAPRIWVRLSAANRFVAAV